MRNVDLSGMTRRTFVGLVAAAPLAGAFRARAASPTPVTAAFGAIDLAYLPTILALEKGFAAMNGLAMTIRVTEGGPQARTMVAAGDAHFGHSDSTLPLQLIAKGVPTKILMSTEAEAPYANLIIRQDLFDSGVNSVEKLGDWKRSTGEKPIVGVSAIGSGSWIWGSYLFEKIGKGSAINFVAGGSAFTSLAALSSGRFDALMGSPEISYQAASEKWGQVAFDVTNAQQWNGLIGGPIPASAVYALQSTIDSNPAMVGAYVKSVLQALTWLKSASNDEVVALVRTRYFPNAKPESMAYALDFHRKTMNFSGIVDAAQYDRAAPAWFRPNTGLTSVPFAEAIDAKFIKGAQ